MRGFAIGAHGDAQEQGWCFAAIYDLEVRSLEFIFEVETERSMRAAPGASGEKDLPRPRAAFAVCLRLLHVLREHRVQLLVLTIVFFSFLDILIQSRYQLRRCNFSVRRCARVDTYCVFDLIVT